MTRIFVTRDIPDSGLLLLQKQKNVQVDVYEKDRKISRRELLKRVKGVDIILSILTEKIDAEVMNAAGDQLKMIANYAVGFDNIDLEEARKRGIVVTNTPCPEVSEAVAEHAVALIFGLAHRVVETDYFTRMGRYKAWGPKLLLGSDVAGKTLGIIGGGHIGYALARRMYDGFNVSILYHDIRKNPDLEKKFKAKYRSKNQLLKEADFVSIHLPLLPTTRHYISTEELALMKPSAFLINTARGPIVDELALIKALTNKQIAGAGLDVYECEPLIDCNPRDTYSLRKLPNVIMTPHTASATLEARQAMSKRAAENIIAYLLKKTIPNKIV